MRAFFSKKTYLDYASLCPLPGTVSLAMTKMINQNLGNPSSGHNPGLKAKKVLEDSRTIIAGIINAHTDEIIFTGSGTESIALSIMGTIYIAKEKFDVPHIITSTIEHSAVLETCRLLEKRGHAEVSYISPNDNGIISPEDILKEVKENTVLVSIHLVNSEIGVIQPVPEYIKILNKFKEKKYNLESIRFTPKSFYPYLHIDACQAFAHMDISPLVRKGIDMVSFNSTKIGGPAGIAALYKRRHADISPIYGGGDQEFSLRSGTSSYILAHGFNVAAINLSKEREKNEKFYKELKEFLLAGLMEFKDKPIYFIENSNTNSVPSIVNISFPYLSGEQMMIELNARGVYVSSKSACKSESSLESYVVEEIRKRNSSTTYNNWGSIRISFGPKSTKSDINMLLKALKDIHGTYLGVLY